MTTQNPPPPASGTQGPEVVLLPHARALAWPRRKYPTVGWQKPIQEILDTPYPTDAHFTTYGTHLPYRLDKMAPRRIAGGVEMRLLIHDVDCPDSHRALGGKTKTPAPEWWWQEQRALVVAMQAALDGWRCSRTRGGYRLVGLPEQTTVIKTPEDADAWKVLYLRRCAVLLRWGIICDPTCFDWTHLFRAPHSTRDEGGVPEALEELGTLGVVPMPAYDQDRDARALYELAKTHGPWASKLKYLGIRRPNRTTVEPKPTTKEQPSQGEESVLGKDKKGPKPPSRHDRLRSLILQQIRSGISPKEVCKAALALDATFEEPTNDGNQIVRMVNWALEKYPQKKAKQIAKSIPVHESANAIASAIRDPNLHDLRWIGAPPGTGKTEQYLRWVIDQAQAGGKAIVAVPTVKLIHELERRLRKLGYQGDIRIHRGHLTVMNPDGTPACKRHAIAKAVCQDGARSMERTMCQPKYGGPCPEIDTCPARKTLLQEREKGDLILTTHASFPSVAKEHVKAMLVIDETPAVCQSITRTREQFNASNILLYAERYQKAFLPMLYALHQQFDTLSDHPVPLLSILSERQKLNILELRKDEERPDPTLSPWHSEETIKRIAVNDPTIGPRLAILSPLFRASEHAVLYEVPTLVSVTHNDDGAPTISITQPGTLWQRLFPIGNKPGLGRQVTVMTAFPETAATQLSSFVKKTHTQNIEVEPLMIHPKTWYRTNGVSKNAMTVPSGGVNHSVLACLIRKALEWLKDVQKQHEIKDCVLSCSQYLEGAIARAIEEPRDLPQRWIQFKMRRSGVKFHLLHYGNLLGTDDYKDCQAAIVLGDYIKPPEISKAEAMLTGFDHHALVVAMASQEAAQALARIRYVWATEAKPQLAISAYQPRSWEDDPEVQRHEYHAGKPPLADPLHAALLQDYLAATGTSQRNCAAALGVTLKNLQAWLTCDAAMPDRVRAALGIP